MEAFVDDLPSSRPDRPLRRVVQADVSE